MSTLGQHTLAFLKETGLSETRSRPSPASPRRPRGADGAHFCRFVSTARTWQGRANIKNIDGREAMRSFQVAEIQCALERGRASDAAAVRNAVLIKVKAAGVCHSDLHIWEAVTISAMAASRCRSGIAACRCRARWGMRPQARWWRSGRMSRRPTRATSRSATSCWPILARLRQMRDVSFRRREHVPEIQFARVFCDGGSPPTVRLKKVEEHFNHADRDLRRPAGSA